MHPGMARTLGAGQRPAANCSHRCQVDCRRFHGQAEAGSLEDRFLGHPQSNAGRNVSGLQFAALGRGRRVLVEAVEQGVGESFDVRSNACCIGPRGSHDGAVAS